MITISGRLPGLNDYTKACRANKFAGAGMKREAEKQVELSLIGCPKFTSKVRLNFRWYEKDMRRDYDNICFAKKFILDALVRAGIIKTDSWRGVIGFTDEFFIDRENPRIEVEIEEEDYEKN